MSEADLECLYYKQNYNYCIKNNQPVMPVQNEPLHLSSTTTFPDPSLPFTNPGGQYTNDSIVLK